MYQLNMSLGQGIVDGAKKDNKFGDRKNHSWFKPENVGLHRVRILPPYSAAGDFGKSVHTFFNMPSLDPAKKETFLCVERTFPERGIRCPFLAVIQEIDQMSQGGTKFKFDRYSAGPTPRYYANVLVRSTTNTKTYDQNTIYIGNFTGGMREWVWSKIMDPDWGNITDPYSGRDIKITKKGEGKNTSYDREVVPNSSPIITNTDEIEAFISVLPNLDEIWRFPSDEELEKQKESASIFKESTLRKFGLISGNIITNQFQPQQQQAGFNPTPVQQQQAPAEPQYSASAPIAQQPVYQPTPQPVQQPVPQAVQLPVIQDPVQVSQKKAPSVPSGAPDCFGDATVYDEAVQKCNICIFEFECATKIKTK